MSTPFKKYFNLSIILIFTGFGFSCVKNKNRDFNILSKADSVNYENLKNTVSAHYQSQDSLEIRSSNFLLENAKYHYALTGPKTLAYISTIEKSADSSLTEEIKKIKDLRLDNDKIEQDVSYLSQPYLAANIREALKSYRNNTAWAKDISVENFCNYVLPYRIGTEPLSDWRSHFSKLFFKENDSSIFKKDLRLAINDLHTWLHAKKTSYKVSFGINSLNYPDLPPALADKLTEGSCHELSWVSISVLRALGIPATQEFIPVQLNLNNGHEWCAVVFRDSSYTFDMVAPRVNQRDKNYLPSKVYRTSFEPVKGNHFDERGYINYLPSFFNNPFLMDATKYYAQTSNIREPISVKTMGSPDYCYLSVFNVFNKSTWSEVGWGRIEGSDYTFTDVCRKGVYLPVYFSETGDKMPLGDPIHVAEDGTIRHIKADTLHYETVKLERKYVINSEKRRFLRRMIGGKFQGSNFPDFRDAEDLYQITENPGEHFNTITLNTDKKFRFIRYASPKEGYGNLAELKFYEHESDTARVKGKVIGTINPKSNNSKNTREAAFDGNVLTYFDTEQADSVWVGLDLGQRKSIKKIQYIARMDMNAIQDGNEYELFYWNNQWKSLGTKIGGKTSVTFRAPKNALLWLRNLTEGVEERIFTYEENKQVWW